MPILDYDPSDPTVCYYEEPQGTAADPQSAADPNSAAAPQPAAQPAASGGMSNEEHIMCAALAMLVWARTIFADRAYLPPTDPLDPSKSYQTLSKMGPLAECYRSCYRRFCDLVGIVNPTTQYYQAIQRLEECIAKMRETGFYEKVYRCSDNDKHVWELVSPMDMHTRIMALYQSWMSSRKSISGKGK